MTTATLEPSFVLGEISPSLFGRFDLARIHVAATTMRNMYAGYRGGAYSRAGTAFVGFSKQTGRSVPPRLIPFQFSINQGLGLEFGNFYMRVVSDGGFVTAPPITITGITNANPGVMTIAAFSIASAVANNGAVSASYNTSETVTIAGGVFSQAAVLKLTNTALASAVVNNPTGFFDATGIGYKPGDILTLAGGATSQRPTVVVQTTQGCSQNPAGNWAIVNTGTGGAPGPVVLTGTTGTGTKYQVNGTINAGGHLVSLGTMVVTGSYTANPNSSGDPVTGGGLVGAKIVICMGVATIAVLSPGAFTVNPFGGALTQVATTGTQSGATFTGLFGPGSLTVTTPGVYSVLPANPAAQSATSGTGVGATFTLGTVAASFATGDWAALAAINGMTALNGQTLVLTALTSTTYALSDVYGNPINTTALPAYAGGGTASRIYTLTTPYAEADLEYIKFTESADVMSLCCVNQATGTEYPPQDLSRFANTNWQFTPVVPAPSVEPPNNASGAASAGGGADYAYQVTALSPVDGTESIASNIATITAAVNIAATAGAITITWDSSVTAGVNIYNVYKATPTLSGTPVPDGSLFGFAGQAYGNQFIDSNIVSDLAQVPPTHQNPFARGQVIGAAVTSSTGTVNSVTFTINTTTGSGAVLAGVIVSTTLVAILVADAGQNYGPNDTVTVTVSGGGAATATLSIGAESGTYPGTVTYFQERRAYGYTLNNPDTYFMSQPGAFTNFDSRNPTIDTDAIIGSPWSVQVNGIQFMVPTAGGLLVFTGLSCWLLVGAGSFATNVQAISPASQLANPQPAVGCSPTLPPIKINYEVIFVGSKNSFYYGLPYQLYALSEPVDYTTNSAHLFTGYTFREHAWCEQPNRLMWTVRNDGVMLSFTYLKAEQVASWARHDTFGTWQSVCSVTEPPVDALYLAAQRNIGTHTAYTIERMDNHIWGSVEQTWCVDCGFSLPQPAPSASLSANSPTGLGACTGTTGLVGGGGYSAAAFGIVVDAPLTPNGLPGPGAGAAPTLTIAGGIVTGVTFAGGNRGTGYLNPQLVISDPAGSAGGSGASATITLDNSATFTASAGIFSAPNVGSVIRMGGGTATITAFTDTQHVVANITTPITQTQPNSSPVAAQSVPAGSWTMTAPVSTVYVPQLAGATVTGLADGNVIPAATVPANGLLALPVPASQVTIGFGFQAQLQSVYLDAAEPGGTMQAQRKKVAAANVLLEASRGVKMGSNQVDGSTLSPIQVSPRWDNLDAVPDQAGKPYNSSTIPLFTGYQRVPVQGGFQKPGQVCLQQDNPLPMNILALVPEFLEGDTPSQNVPKREQKAA